LALEEVKGLAHGGGGGAKIDEAGLAALIPDGNLRLGDEGLGGIKLSADAGENSGGGTTILGIASGTVGRGAACETRSVGRVCPGQRAIGYRICVHVLIAPPILALYVLEPFEFVCAQHLASIVHVGVVPSEWLGHPLVHADVEVRHDDHGGLEALSEVEGL